MTEAARELDYSQPSVSHHLSRLEAATGVKLVQQIGLGIRLTPGLLDEDPPSVGVRLLMRYPSFVAVRSVIMHRSWVPTFG